MRGMKILSFTDRHVDPNPYDFFIRETKVWGLEEGAYNCQAPKTTWKYHNSSPFDLCAIFQAIQSLFVKHRKKIKAVIHSKSYPLF